jgi:peptidoglycan/xylan/chitin deacetylase (PgdA/CDA1 family)
MSHPILSNESDRNAEKEIRESLEQLSRMLGMEARYFCYPNGTRLDYGTREQLILRESNVRLSFTGKLAFFGRNADPLSLPRARVSTSGEEGNLAILGKLLLLPIWDTMRSFVRFGKTEARERKQIKALAIF